MFLLVVGIIGQHRMSKYQIPHKYAQILNITSAVVGRIEQHRISKESEPELLSRKRDEEELETIVVFSETVLDFQL